VEKKRNSYRFFNGAIHLKAHFKLRTKTIEQIQIVKEIFGQNDQFSSTRHKPPPESFKVLTHLIDLNDLKTKLGEIPVNKHISQPLQTKSTEINTNLQVYRVSRIDFIVFISSNEHSILSTKFNSYPLPQDYKSSSGIINNLQIQPGFLRINACQKIITANQQLAELLGYSNSDQLLLSVDFLNQLLYRQQQLEDHVAAFIESNAPYLIQNLTLKKNNGLLINCIFCFYRLNESVIDILVEKNEDFKQEYQEDSFKKMFMEDNEMKLLIDPLDKRIIKANPAAMKFYGWKPEALSGIRLYELNAASADEIDQIVTKVRNRINNHLFLRHNTPNGIREVEVYANPIKLQGKTFLFAIIHDVTESKKQEMQLVASEKKLKEMNESKDKFFNIIAHDLKTPFAQITKLAELALSSYQQEKFDDLAIFLNYLEKSSRQGFALLNNLLTWARNQVNQSPFNLVSFNPEEIINEVMEECRITADQKEMKLISRMKSTKAVIADENMVKSILRNLINNAIKFSFRQGKVILSVEESQDRFNFCVRDFGTGIPESDQHKIFRLDSHHTCKGTENEQGNGLGLIICKEFAEKNNGTLSFKSKPGSGTCFCLSLPVHQVI
jgi:PAS domain S-box-containing protein